MLAISPIIRLARSLWTGYERTRTQRILADLPPYLRKDIGWPDAAPQRPRRQ